MLFFEFWTIIEYVLYVINLSMKRLFMQLLQWINRYKKRLIYGALALFIGQICFFNLWWFGINNVTYAAEPNTPSQKTDFQDRAGEWLSKLSFLKKWCYILLYPILVLAGALVNNSMVYAEVFSFDVVLWQFWNVVRNLANYALWFLFVFKIFQFLIGGQKAGDLGKLLTSTLIAWIWIQASWFLLAVLIDISNVLTYSLGWLPIHILWTQSDAWDDGDFWNPYVLQTVISVDLDDADSVYVYLSNTSTGASQWWNHFIAECETFTLKWSWKWENFIVAPKIVYYYDGKSYHETEQLLCHVWDDVYRLAKFAEGIQWQSGENWKDSQIKYHNSLTEAITVLEQKDEWWIRGYLSAWTVLQIRNAHATWDSKVLVPYNENQKMWLDVNNERIWSEWKMARLHDILEWDDGYVWVFSALYSSLLNAGADFQIPNAWVYGELLNTMLSFCHVIAVWIPLLAMLVVFFMRIWVIWMAIILSPIIILLKAFKLEDKLFKKDSILGNLTVSNLVGIILSPAVVCFAVSISTVLVRIISTVNAERIMENETPILWWLIELNIAGFWVGTWKLICSVIWVAISWFLIWTAIEASALWKSELIKNIKDFATTTLWSIPIVPIPWKNWVSFVWVNAVKQIPSAAKQYVKDTFGTASNDAVEDLINPSRAAGRRADAYKDLINSSNFNLNSLQGNDWTTQEIEIKSANWSYKQDFNSLPWEKKREIITTINNMADVNKRKAFGSSKPIIQFTNGEDKVEIWEFNKNGDNTYDLQS